VHVFGLRRQSGDDASCLNLYKPRSPTLLGVSDALIERGGFAFGQTMAETDAERANPWLLLRRKFDDGAIPVMGDASTLTWLLKLSVGGDLHVKDAAGGDVTLRIVATMPGSLFQSELLMSEASLLRLYPRSPGYSMLLIDCPYGERAAVGDAIESRLADNGCDVSTTESRIAGFMAVENTYLSTFLLLGGLGLLLGTIGVGAVLARNMLERRAELALLSALGVSHGRIARLMLLEAGAAIVGGVAAGTVCGIVAILPNAIASAREIPWATLLGLMAVILMVGLLSSGVAFSLASRGRIVASLRAT
jgi:hypothetical protein